MYLKSKSLKIKIHRNLPIPIARILIVIKIYSQILMTKKRRVIFKRVMMEIYFLLLSNIKIRQTKNNNRNYISKIYIPKMEFLVKVKL